MSKTIWAPAYTDTWFKWKIKWRLSRKSFILQSIAYAIASLIALAIILNYETWGFWWILWTVFWWAFIPMLITVHVKRFHDLDKNWWWVILEFSLILNFLIWPLLYFIKWTSGPNNYWFDPLMDYEKQKKSVNFKDNKLIIKEIRIKENQSNDIGYDSGWDFD